MALIDADALARPSRFGVRMNLARDKARERGAVVSVVIASLWRGRLLPEDRGGSA
jgi:hypothetical protein